MQHQVRHTDQSLTKPEISAHQRLVEVEVEKGREGKIGRSRIEKGEGSYLTVSRVRVFRQGFAQCPPPILSGATSTRFNVISVLPKPTHHSFEAKKKHNGWE